MSCLFLRLLVRQDIRLKTSCPLLHLMKEGRYVHCAMFRYVYPSIPSPIPHPYFSPPPSPMFLTFTLIIHLPFSPPIAHPISHLIPHLIPHPSLTHNYFPLAFINQQHVFVDNFVSELRLYQKCIWLVIFVVKNINLL